jgi:hypothetical protein
MTDNAHTAHGNGRSAATVVADYFTQLAVAAAAAGATIGPESLAELHSHVDDRLRATPGTAADATAVLAEFGSPTKLATAFASSATEDDTEPHAGPRQSSGLAGRTLGIPYDVRPPNSDRYANRLWDPTNPRVFVPRLFGVGWSVNFAALAVKARLVRPDDEDDPFATVPERAVTATLAAPIAVVLAIGALVVARWSGLPSTLPTHWGLNGEANGYGSRGAALLIVGVLALVPLLFAVGVHLRRRRPLSRVVAAALSLAFAALAFAVLAQILMTVDGGAAAWPLWAGIVGFVALPLLLLVGVSRLGRVAEQRRDFSTS